jgi:hypothetical protein
MPSKIHRRFWLPLMLFTLIACSNMAPAQTPTKLDSLSTEQLKTVVIRFQRTECYGSCPAYKVTIFGDGRVEYVGEKNVKVQGKKNGRIGEGDLRSLLAAFSKADFFSLGENLGESKCSCALWTDFPTTLTEITIGSSTHRLEHYAGCGCASKELFALEDEIDKAAKVQIWTGDVSKAGPFGTTRIR